MSDQLTNPAEVDETLEVTLGRRAPFSQLGDWVLFSGVDSDARTLYWGLSAHINTSERGDTEVWPGLATLARILQLKKPENVSKFMLQLEVIGAIDVVRTMVGLVRRNRYIVHQTQPASHTGARSTSEWYALNRGPKGETAEARKEREAQFDRWLTAVRDALKAHCDKVGKARAAAKKAKAPFPAVELFIAPLLADFRTPSTGGTARPAVIQKAAGQPVPPRQGVRTPWRGGPVPPGEGVERDQHQLDQSLSPVPHGSEHPADPADVTDEARETASPEDNRASAAAEVPAPRDGQADNKQRSELLEMLLGLPGRDRMNHDEVTAMLLPLAVESLAAGWTAPKLRNHLARSCDPDRVFNPAAVYRMHLKKLPSAPAGAGGHPVAAAPECSKCNGSGLAEDPDTFLPTGVCECRKAPALTAAS
ncbi:hypothetical protein [Streptomyces sp. CB02115]|uniref:hypothetical protein n=1 Tax=Streptomyces sp. CB02115 TaxID=1703939 RepID=UPI00093A2D8B|nr:hypothetical protein [Streptomyces sp. CB02115]OKJ46860.1 hypothetical protein AMK28_37410 [Streptomyces sp. CB02115]